MTEALEAQGKPVEQIFDDLLDSRTEVLNRAKQGADDQAIQEGVKTFLDHAYQLHQTGATGGEAVGELLRAFGHEEIIWLTTLDLLAAVTTKEEFDRYRLLAEVFGMSQLPTVKAVLEHKEREIAQSQPAPTATKPANAEAVHTNIAKTPEQIAREQLTQLLSRTGDSWADTEINNYLHYVEDNLNRSNFSDVLANALELATLPEELVTPEVFEEIMSLLRSLSEIPQIREEVDAMYARQARRNGVLELTGGKWLGVDGWQCQTLNDDRDDVPSKYDLPAVRKRQFNIGTWNGNDGLITVVRQDGCICIGLINAANVEALEQANYPRNHNLSTYLSSGTFPIDDEARRCFNALMVEADREAAGATASAATQQSEAPAQAQPVETPSAETDPVAPVSLEKFNPERLARLAKELEGLQEKKLLNDLSEQLTRQISNMATQTPNAMTATPAIVQAELDFIQAAAKPGKPVPQSQDRLLELAKTLYPTQPKIAEMVYRVIRAAQLRVQQQPINHDLGDEKRTSVKVIQEHMMGADPARKTPLFESVNSAQFIAGPHALIRMLEETVLKTDSISSAAKAQSRATGIKDPKTILERLHNIK